MKILKNLLIAGALVSTTLSVSAARWGTLQEEPGEGVSSQWVRNSISYMNIGGLMEAEGADVGGALTMVTAEDGTIWIDYPISSFRTNGWLQGKIEGDKMTFSLPQCIVEDEGTPFYLAVVDREGIMLDDQDYTLTKQGENWVSDDATACLGIVSSNGDWMYCSDYDYIISPFTSVGAEAPKGLETKNYVFRSGDTGHYVKVGVDGDDIWVKGLLESAPDNWILGKRSGDVVSFKTGAYLGTYDDFQVTPHHVYFMACKIVKEEYFPIDNLEYKWNQEDESMTTDGTFIFNFSPNKEEVFYLQSAEGSTFTVSNGLEMAMTPAMPTDVIYNYGDESVISLIPQLSENDEILDTEKLFYIVYIGDKPLTFDQNDYFYLDMEEMTEVPYSYTDNYDFIINGTYHEIYLYNVGNNKVGIQSVYYGGGERRVSDIRYSDNTIVNGVGELSNDENAAPEIRYDLSGCPVRDNRRGIVITNKGKKLLIGK